MLFLVPEKAASINEPLEPSTCIWYGSAGRKAAFSLHVQPSVRSARFHAGGPHTALEAKQLGVRIKCEAMPAHTVKKKEATVYANYTEKKKPWQTAILLRREETKGSGELN